MPRKSRKKSKLGGESDGQEKSTDKISQEMGVQIPSSSSSIHKPVTTKRQTRGSSAKTVGQDSNIKASTGSTDAKLLAMLKKQGIQEVLSAYRQNATSTSPLSNFKIPRKKSESSTRNQDTGPKALEPGKASSSPEKPVKKSLSSTNKVEHEKKACKRKSEAIGEADQTTQSLKRCSSGVEVAKGKANVQETVTNQTTRSNFCETITLRPLMKARRTLPSSLSGNSSPVPPPPASTSPVDTPQMKELKAQIASRKKKEVRKEQKRLSSPPAVYTKLQALTSTPSRTNNNSINKSCSQRSSDTMKACFAEPHITIAEDNAISEILQIVRNDGPDSYVQFDTTDAMDVDMVQTASTTVKKLMIIVDTNVWIGDQLLIRELLDVDFQVLTGSIKPTVIIPWMVLQEIDHLMHKKSDKVAGLRGAPKFIYNLLKSKQTQVKGEKPIDALIGNEFSELMADDSILNCAIKCSKLAHVKTVLLTNDINFLNKALVQGLAAFEANNELISNIRRCLSDKSDSYSHIISDLDKSSNTSVNQSNAFSSPSNSFVASPFHAVNSSFTSNSSSQIQECIPLEDFEMDVDDPMEMDDSELHTSETSASKTEEISSNPNQYQFTSSSPFEPPTFENVATAVQQSLTSIIVPKMVEEYGQDDWKFAIKIKPPFTVESALKCIQAHWIAVFSYMFSSRSKNTLDELINKFHQKPTSLNSGDFKVWRLTISQLALALLSHNENISNRPRVADCCSLLQAYIQVESNNST